MKEWKIRQQYYHMLHQGKYDDDLNEVEIRITQDVTEDAVRHFYEYVDEWIYPSKSYVVAICYASWITRDFGEDFYETLNDPELLMCNDPYFIPYEQDKDQYDAIIDHISIPPDHKGMVPDIYQYYQKEILQSI